MPLSSGRCGSKQSREKLVMSVTAVAAAVIIYIHTKADRKYFDHSTRLKSDVPAWKSNQCTEAEILENVDYINQNGGFSELTKCPDEKWLIEWREKLPSRASFTTLEVGCNKATDAVFLLKLFSKEDSVDLYDWIQKIDMSRSFACPPEDKEKYDAVVQILPKLSHISRYRHYCVEPIKETYDVLEKVLNDVGYHKLGLSVHQYAISASNDPEYVLFSPLEAGTESVGIDTQSLGNVTYQVRATSIDMFMLHQKVEEINMLRIDTEGNDPRVLLGASNTLSKMKPSYVSFENHAMGRWATFDLKDIIDYLDNLSYDCYWATTLGTLVKITCCWSSEYGQWKDWSNLACAHRDDKLLHSIFEKYRVQCRSLNIYYPHNTVHACNSSN